ncbi:tRNA (Thr-GGU) A37 N-methylase [Halanaeroarchaeum sp. HSR-CO]|uniref:tRNA (N6-threonylcarbamoyladenosine(37)-N6)-methyltransferase TrmO n=1 Tax=Halanaeroarchaeum sp. HSR-CO TaxID=2866382 RepID=UPI00217E5A81|nr:tRNA (N6-threonylcarbamoyladenosine(37)-N6)-methyltransferase TrmO [Halanaeroarchaeum sp. HSR-CO]UWG47779.1 tRNA (Thr-GGU) A37 N-methylase [Halanaeroarchaeum sp. HSR-CO]
MIELSPIGRVRTPITATSEAPRQGSNDDIEGTIELESEYEAGLAGIEAGDSLIVVWFAHEADRTLLRLDRIEGRGVFASRSPARPNPIVLTTVEVLAMDGSTLTVRGVDMVDKSPVLDLKVPLD